MASEAEVFEEEVRDKGAITPAVSRGEGPAGAASFGRGWSSGETERLDMGLPAYGEVTWVIWDQFISGYALEGRFQKAPEALGYRGPRPQDPKFPEGP